MQAIESDLLEATAHARTMTPDEVEEGIDHIRNEVISLSIAIADFSFTFWIEHSIGMILFVDICHMTGIHDRTIFLSNSSPPRIIEAAERYRSDEELRNDPPESQRIYEELKVEVTLLKVVCFSILRARFEPHLYY